MNRRDEIENAGNDEWLKRCQYLESRIEELALFSGHVSVNDNGEWKTVSEWAESVIRGDETA